MLIRTDYVIGRPSQVESEQDVFDPGDNGVELRPQGVINWHIRSAGPLVY